MLERFSIEGKVVVVTGASSGLGHAFAQEMAAEGATVVLAARRVDRLQELEEQIKKAGGTSLSVACDVAKPADCQKVADDAMTAFGKIDVLVNNAGKGTAIPATRETPEEFREVIEINLMGSYWMAQACGRVMQPGSSIINISSVLALRTLELPQAAYSASKAGVLGLTRDLAQQWTGRRGIRVNAIVPGFFETEMAEQYPEGYLENMVAKRVLVGRPGKLTECTSAVMFLASDASSYITGTALEVDGGLLIT